MGKKKSPIKHGVVFNNIFYSDRMERKLPKNTSNGIYSMDMSQDDFVRALSPANIVDAVKSFRNSSRMRVVRGIGFHDRIVPENPVKYSRIPFRVHDAVYDEFDEIEVVILRTGLCYFIQIVETEKMFTLIELKDALDNDTSIDDIKGVSPEMRIVYTFHILEKEQGKRREAQEQRRRALEVPVNAIRHIMEGTGAVVRDVRKTNRGFDVSWEMHGHEISTLLGPDFRVIEGGFCMSGYDNTQSVRSVVNVLDDYVQQGDYIHRTRQRN